MVEKNIVASVNVEEIINQHVPEDFLWPVLIILLNVKMDRFGDFAKTKKKLIAIEKDIKVVIATHSTAIISAFSEGSDLAIVPVSHKGQSQFSLFRRSKDALIKTA